MRVSLLALAAFLAAPAAATDPVEDFEALTDEYWAAYLKEYPATATSVGVEGHDDKLMEISLAAMDRRAAMAADFLERSRGIPAEGLDATTRVSKAMLERSLAAWVEGNRYGQRTMLFTTYYGWHQAMAGLARGLAFDGREDYENYLKRLEAYPAQNAGALDVSNAAIEGGYVLPCDVLDGYETTITGVIGEDPQDSRFYEPFSGLHPADMTADEWAELQGRAIAIIDGPLRKAYAEHARWFMEDYLPECAEEVGVSAQQGGADYYAHQIRQFTTTDLSADEIHRIGLAEVARIRAEMEEVAERAGFESREAFIEDLRTNPDYYAKSPEELLAAAAWEAKKTDGLMPRFFKTLPRLPYGIKAIPAEIAEGTTTAYYSSGSPEQGIAGTYYVNTSKLDQRPLYELTALSLHEGVPGHHHQNAIRQEIDLPLWRRMMGNSAFGEGWGLYSERLGIEMGLYDTPAKEMGRLSYEMWRANRLVVDTGIHAKGWSKAQAIDYMLDNTALTRANIEAEVNRYISWPGQALAYKIGELKIRELRAKAEAELGDAFDLREFHDVILTQGSVPLDILEGQVEEWIASVKAG